MRDDVAPPRDAALPRAAAALAGAVTGALLACVGKGIAIGVEQTDSGFGWLSVPIDAVGGIGLLFVDLLTLTGPPGVSLLVVLPWAGVGALLGAFIGMRSAGRSRG